MNNIKQRLREDSNNPNKPELEVGDDVIKNKSKAHQLAQDWTLKYVGSKNGSNNTSNTNYSEYSTSMVSEDDAVIEPKDKATIKYLSNVKDPDTGKISKPFVIGAKNYQLIRGIKPNREVVLSVLCLDDVDESGNKIIHSAEDFDKNIATPIKKLEEEQIQAKAVEEAKLAEQQKKLAEEAAEEEKNYQSYEHFYVDKKTGKVRGFKDVQTLVSKPKLETEEYMSLQEFKKYKTREMFGDPNSKKGNVLNEVTPTGQETDEEMSDKAQKLMAMIKKRIPPIIISSIKTPVAKREVIAAFAEVIGVPRNGLANLISGLKDLANVDRTQTTQTVQQGQQVQQQPQEVQPIQERKILTKNDLVNSLKITKIIKVKDIK